MDPEEYRRMGEFEASMWWYRGLHANVLNAISSHASSFKDLLDAGCGTGGILKTIRDRFPNARLHGLDISEIACTIAREKSGASVTLGAVDRLPYEDQAFDVVVSLDVLGYNIDRDATVRGFYRVLRPGGHVVINFPSYQWMLSYHDRAVGQAKRFTLTEVKGLLERHGFHLKYTSYWNTFLFPLMVIRRKLLPSSSTSDVTSFDPVVNKAFETVLSAERVFMDREVPLPFGGSIFLIAERPRP